MNARSLINLCQKEYYTNNGTPLEEPGRLGQVGQVGRLDDDLVATRKAVAEVDL
jgi:hypothetical protein